MEREAKRRRAPQAKPEGNPRTEAGAGSPKGNTGREAAGCGPKLPSQEGLKQETEMVLAGLEETDSTDQPSAHRRCQRPLPRRVRRAPGLERLDRTKGFVRNRTARSFE